MSCALHETDHRRYLLAFLDRVNIANARSFNLEEDLGLVGSQYNTGKFQSWSVMAGLPYRIARRVHALESPKLWRHR